MHGSIDTTIRAESSYKKNPLVSFLSSKPCSDLITEASQT